MTPPLDLNLATRPFRNNTMLWVTYGLAAGAVTAFTAWNLDSYLEHARRLAEGRGALEAAIRRNEDLDRRGKEAQRGIDGIDVKALRTQTEKANDVIERRALSWTRLFNVMERVQPYEVRLTSIRPVYLSRESLQTERGRLPDGAIPVSVEGAAQSIEAFLEFERSLILDGHFSRVEPERTELTKQGELVFEIRFLYFAAGTDEKPPADAIPHVLEAAAHEAADPAEAAAVGAMPQAPPEPTPPPERPRRGRR